jgi:hypothetical protein
MLITRAILKMGMTGPTAGSMWPPAPHHQHPRKNAYLPAAWSSGGLPPKKEVHPSYCKVEMSEE